MIIPHFSITGLDVPFFVDTLLIFSSLRNLTQCAAPQSCVFQPTCFNQILANWGIILIKSHEITIVFLQIPWASHETTFFVSSVQLIDDVPWFSHWNANFPSDFPSGFPTPFGGSASTFHCGGWSWSLSKASTNLVLIFLRQVFDVACTPGSQGLPHEKWCWTPHVFQVYYFSICLRLAMQRGRDRERWF